jgi:hypothetical protein
MTAAADQELAFAGPAALAKLVRERQIRPRELWSFACGGSNRSTRS